MKLLSTVLAMGRAKPSEGKSTTTGAPAVQPTAAERAEILAVIEKFFEPFGGEISRAPSLRAETFRAIAGNSPTPLATLEEIATLNRLEQERTTAWDLANSLTPAAAKKAFLAQQNEAADRARVGGEREAQDAWSLADFQEDFRARCKSAKAGAFAAEQEATPIILAIAERFRKFAQGEIERELVDDFRRFQRFGIPFKPSLLVESLHCGLAQLEKHLPREGRGVSPASAIYLFNLS